MSSMFKKKTGPSIKPKFVPRGRPAAPSATPAPAPTPPTAATASPAPQPTKHVEAPTRVPSPRAQRRVSVAETSKAQETNPQQSTASVANSQAPSTSPALGNASQPTKPPARPVEPQPQPASQPTAEDRPPSASTQIHHSVASSASTSTHTDAVPPQQEENLPANPTVSISPQPPTIAQSPDTGLPTPSTQPLAEAQPIPDEPAALPQPTAEAVPKPKPARQPRKRAAPEATTSQQENEPIDSIEPASQPAKRPRQRKTQAPQETTNGTPDGTQPKPKRQRRKRQTEGADGAGGDTQRRQSRARSGTPPGAEEETVDIQKLKMSDLTRDLRIGKKFSRHDELRDRERQERLRRSADPKASQTPGPPTPADARASPATPAPTPSGAQAPAGPQFQIVNGQIVVDQTSLVMDRHARDAIDGPIEEIEENEFTHKVTSNSYRTGSKLRGPNHWSAEDTEKFYEYLAMHGTDFSIITSLFPGRQRRHIKMKFNREEKFSRERIDAVLIGPKTKMMGFEEYKKVTGREYDLTEVVQAELAKDNEEREAALKAKEDADARENQQRLEAIHGTGEKETVKK